MHGNKYLYLSGGDKSLCSIAFLYNIYRLPNELSNHSSNRNALPSPSQIVNTNACSMLNSLMHQSLSNDMHEREKAMIWV